MPPLLSAFYIPCQLLPDTNKTKQNIVLILIFKCGAKTCFLPFLSLISLFALGYFQCQCLDLPLKCHEFISCVQIWLILEEDGISSQKPGWKEPNSGTSRRVAVNLHQNIEMRTILSPQHSWKLQLWMNRQTNKIVRTKGGLWPGDWSN